MTQSERARLEQRAVPSPCLAPSARTIPRQSVPRDSHLTGCPRRAHLTSSCAQRGARNRAYAVWRPYYGYQCCVQCQISVQGLRDGLWNPHSRSVCHVLDRCIDGGIYYDARADREFAKMIVLYDTFDPFRETGTIRHVAGHPRIDRPVGTTIHEPEAVAWGYDAVRACRADASIVYGHGVNTVKGRT